MSETIKSGSPMSVSADPKCPIHGTVFVNGTSASCTCHHILFPAAARPVENSDPIIERCSFCGKAREQVEHFIVGYSVRICNECVAQAASVLRSARPVENSELPKGIRNIIEHPVTLDDESMAILREAAADVVRPDAAPSVENSQLREALRDVLKVGRTCCGFDARNGRVFIPEGDSDVDDALRRIEELFASQDRGLLGDLDAENNRLQSEISRLRADQITKEEARQVLWDEGEDYPYDGPVYSRVFQKIRRISEGTSND